MLLVLGLQQLVGSRLSCYFIFIFCGGGGLRVLGSSCFKGLGFGIRVAVQCGA